MDGIVKKGVSLSVGRGEKLPVAGLTAKGRAVYNAATGSNLKASAPNPNIKAEVKAGKPVKQAVAIAYSVKKQAEKKK